MMLLLPNNAFDNKQLNLATIFFLLRLENHIEGDKFSWSQKYYNAFSIFGDITEIFIMFVFENLLENFAFPDS